MSETPIRGTGWKLAQDLGIDLKYDHGFVIATYVLVDEYGHGASAQQAINDLLTSLVDFRESLERQVAEHSLSSELVGILDKLRILLTQV
jgi:hypothetical protein